MDWTNERYVRLYVRDTLTWQRLGWEGQSVLSLLLRKFDRSGVFELSGMTPVEGVTLSLMMPSEIVERGLDRLMDLGVYVHGADSLVMPKFEDAQASAQAEALRSREYRARRRKDKIDRNVTKRDASVTKRRQSVTENHRPSQTVTPSLAEPSLERLDPSDLVPIGTTPEKAASKVNGGDDPITPEELMETWNDTAPGLGLSKVMDVQGTRRSNVMRRLREHPRVEFWQAVFSAIKVSKLLTGQKPRDPKDPHANWKVSFDWLFENDVNATKVAEKRYD